MARIKRAYDGPDGRKRYDVEDDAGDVRSGLLDDDLELDEATSAAEKKPVAPAAEVKFFQYELEAGVVTINELRASKGLPADGRFGSKTLPEYRAANFDTYKRAALSSTASPAGAPTAPEEAP